MKSRLSRIAAFSLLFSTGLLPLSAQERAANRGSSRPTGEREESRAADYVLQPQDLVRVYVYQEEDINKQGELSISNEHTINLPLIGTISLRGKTVRQAEEMIRALYDKDYLVNPQVTVTVSKYAERSVKVMGAVNEAGPVMFPQEGGLTIVDAISLAGGHSRLADLKKVKLTRRNDSGAMETIEVNVDAMIKGGRDSVVLQKDDVILVPERIL
jgi:polysaccharide biosynthesis/export protein